MLLVAKKKNNFKFSEGQKAKFCQSPKPKQLEKKIFRINSERYAKSI